MRRLPALALALLGLLATSPAALAQDERVIAQGVSAGGVDLGGLTVDQAAARLQADAGLAERLGQDLVLGAAGIPWRLTMAEARLELDARATAERAAAVPPPPPSEPAPEGGRPAGVDVPLALRHSRLAVRAFVRRVARGTWRAPRPARLRMTLRHMRLTRAKVGHRLNKAATARAVNRALDGVDERVLHQRLLRVRPRTTIRDLRDAYPTVITVDREGFRLRLFKRLRISRRYPIAVGMAGLDTPAGRYRIQTKQVNPAWHVPRSAWAGSLAGRTIPPGDPGNPLKARWMGIVNGVGIHGTAESWSIGSRASHGCIRMHVPDVIDLFARTPLGTPVLIG